MSRLDWIPIGGASMWPVLRRGDAAALSPITDGDPVAVGDVVVARLPSQERLMVHRVVRLLPDGRVVLRGDATVVDDAPVTQDALLARVRRIRRGGRVLLRHEWDTPLMRTTSLLGRARARLGKAVRG